MNPPYPSGGILKIVTIICRILLGIPFMIFGANILHPFLRMPIPPPESLQFKFMTVMMPTHWMALVGACQLLGGFLVLLGRTTPLGLVVLGPVLVNILAFHILLENGKDIGLPLVMAALELFLIFAYRGYFAPLMTLQAKPTGSAR